MTVRQLLVGAVAGLAMSVSASAAPIISVGNISLLPNTPNQTFSVFVTAVTPSKA